MPQISGNESDFTFRRYTQSLAETAAWGPITGTVTETDGTDPTTVLIDEDAIFITDNVRVGDTVDNDTDAGASATVVSVDSETQLTTTALAGGAINEWTAADDYTISSPSSVVRIGITPSYAAFVRKINAFTNAATNSILKILFGNNQSDADAKFKYRITQNTQHLIDPDTEATGERQIIELPTGGTAHLNVSLEVR